MYFPINDSALVRKPSPFDAKVCNWHCNDLQVIFETIDDYLGKLESFDRMPEVPVTVLLPKFGYDMLPSYHIDTLGDHMSNFSAHQYAFIGGLTDAHFKEIKHAQAKDGLLSGGQVTWIEGYTYGVGSATYTYDHVETTIADGEVTLSAADATFDRIDLIVLNLETGVFEVIEGIASANPLKPQVGTSQVELTEVLVQAGSTQPSNVTDEIIYDENIEWTPSVVSVTSSDFNSTTLPFRGTKCVDITGVANGSIITFTAPSPVNVADYTMLSFNVKLKHAFRYGSRFYISFYLGAVRVSDRIQIAPSENVLTWQTLASQISAWKFTGLTFDKVEFDFYAKHATYSGFYLDYIKLQEGVSQPDVIETITLSGDVTGSGEVGGIIPTTLKTVNANVGTFGSVTEIPVMTVDGKGRVTGVTVVTVEGGGGSETFVVHINFEDIAAETYICPYAMKFTAIKHSQVNAPTLSVALNTDMAEYDILTITPDALGLVTLTGIWL